MKTTTNDQIGNFKFLKTDRKNCARFPAFSPSSFMDFRNTCFKDHMALPQFQNRLGSTVLLIFFSLVCFAQSYNAELITQRTNIRISNGKLVKELFYELQINNRAGDRYSEISIPFSSISMVSKIEAYVKGRNGNIVKKLRKKDIVEKSSISDISFYEDEFVKEFTLKHNVYPYTIIYSYQVQEQQFLYIDYWMPLISEKIPTHDAKLNLTVPVDYEFEFFSNNVEAPLRDTTEDLITLQWQTSYTNTFKQENFAPHITQELPSVAITPDRFKFEKYGSFGSWTDYGNWQFELLQGLNEIPSNEHIKILTLIENIKEDKEKIRVLYHYLQNETRYINVSIETGGLKPYPATYVAQNKYGDCKALTNYFKSVLDLIGIKSYYSKVYAGSPKKIINKKFPSQQFNHVILYVPLKEEDLWLDCTADGAFNYLGTFTQGRQAFIIEKDNSRFLKTPPLKPEDVLESRTIHISYDPGNSSHVQFNNRYKGAMYESLLYLETNYNESEKSKIVGNYFVGKRSDLLNHQISIKDRDSTFIEFQLDITERDIFNNYGNDILVKNIPFLIPDIERPEVRKLPVQIDYPIHKQDTLIYDIPTGFGWNDNFEKTSIAGKYGRYEVDMTKSGNKIHVTKLLLIHAGQYPLSEYEAFYEFYQKISEAENKSLFSLHK